VAVELLDDSDSDELDPHTDTQLMNNESLAQCSQDTFEDHSESAQLHKQEQALEVSPSKKPLTYEQLKSLGSIEELFRAKRQRLVEKGMLLWSYYYTKLLN